MSEVSKILNAVEKGDPHAAEQLLPLVYGELRKLAAQKLGQEKPGQTLQATALVHEAYLRLVGAGDKQPDWDGRGHFFAAAAEAMRRILIENARRKKSPKHGGDLKRHDPEDVQLAFPEIGGDMLVLDDALKKLTELDPTKARLVQLRYFAGMTIEESAALLHISPATAKRYWTYARAWLFQQISDDGGSPSTS